MKKIIVFLLAALLLAGCAPSEQAIQTAIAQTATHDASLLPTETPTPPATSTSTSTSTATQTRTRLPTFTRTETNTPLPPATLTAEALAQQRTATASVQAGHQTQTAAARNAGSTATAYQRTRIAQYGDIYWQELASYAENHRGEKVWVRIRIFNIVSGRELQGYFAGTYEPIYVKMSASFSGLYEDDTITVYGTVGGYYCFQNTMGNTICHPVLEDAFYTGP